MKSKKRIFTLIILIILIVIGNLKITAIVNAIDIIGEEDITRIEVKNESEIKEAIAGINQCNTDEYHIVLKNNIEIEDEIKIETRHYASNINKIVIKSEDNFQYRLRRENSNDLRDKSIININAENYSKVEDIPKIEIKNIDIRTNNKQIKPIEIVGNHKSSIGETGMDYLDVKLEQISIENSKNGAIFARYANVSIINSKINNNSIETNNNQRNIQINRSANTYIYNTEILGNTGGGIDISWSNDVSIIDSKVNDNIIEKEAGAGISIIAETTKFKDQQLYIINTEINNNKIVNNEVGTSIYAGGGLYSAGYDNINIKNSEINNNISNVCFGGGVNISGNNLIMENVNVKGNESSSSSAMNLSGFQDIKLNKLNIRENNSNGSNSGTSNTIYIRNTRKLELKDSTIESNELYGDSVRGGGLRLENILDAKLDNVKISDHNVKSGYNGEGAGLHYTVGYQYDEHPKLVILNSEFNNNSSSGSGGAIYYSAHSGYVKEPIFEIENSNFKDNYSDRNGGAIDYHVNDGYLNIVNCEFNKNKSIGEGGAIHSSSDSLETKLYRTKFIDNSSNIFGGAIYNNYKDISCRIEDLIFKGNRSNEAGGALFWNNKFSEGMKSNCIININNDSKIHFKNNTSEKGGAIYLLGNDNINALDLGENSLLEFVGNKSYNDGGAVYLNIANFKNSINMLNNSNIKYMSNESLGDGAGLYIAFRNIVSNINENILEINAMENNKIEFIKNIGKNGGAVSYYDGGEKISVRIGKLNDDIKFNKRLYLDDTIEFKDNKADKLYELTNEDRNKYYPGHEDGKYLIKTKKHSENQDNPFNNYDIEYTKEEENRPGPSPDPGPGNSGGGSSGGGATPGPAPESSDKPKDSNDANSKNDDNSKEKDHKTDDKYETHKAYISGYEDGSIRPEANITRQEVAAVFYRLLDKEKRVEGNNIFIDIDDRNWGKEEILCLAELGIISGYKDDTFRPDDNITRGELAKILYEFNGLEEKGDSQFKDISYHWAKKYIDIIYSKDWMNGYPDGSFKPDDDLIRAEFIVAINNMLGRKISTKNDFTGVNTFNDLSKDKWYYKEILEATIEHKYKIKDNEEIWINN